MFCLTPTVAVLAVRAAVKPSYPTETTWEQSFSSQLTKIKTVIKLLCLLPMFNFRILGLIWRGTAYFGVNDTTIIIPGDSDRRASCRTRATHFWRQIIIWRHKMFKFSPLLIWYAFAIMNPFSWILLAREKRCPTSMAVWHQADWHTNLPPVSSCTTWSRASPSCC